MRSPQENNSHISVEVTVVRIHSLRGSTLLLDLKVMTILMILAGELDTTHGIKSMYGYVGLFYWHYIHVCLNAGHPSLP